MSSEPLNKRSVLGMDREITRLRRLEKKYKADNSRLHADVMELESGLVEWKDDGKQAGRTILRLRAELAERKKRLEELENSCRLANAQMLAEKLEKTRRDLSDAQLTIERMRKER